VSNSAENEQTIAMTAEQRKVILASSLGTVFEWYDFYLYGTLTAVIAERYFAPLAPTARFIMALLAFAAGFAVRPLGALVFGRLGDVIGRKYTFLVTILIMGVSTFLVGVLPGYETLGFGAPVILISLRLLQGLALGGEYGGAASYVAEYAPAKRRGAFTAWIQTTATAGLLLSLLVVTVTREALGPVAFKAWGWRIPFLVSVLLLLISLWIRLSLSESPLFQRMKELGRTSRSPLAEAFGQWSNLRVVLIALFGATAGQGVIWYTGQFYALFFLTKTLQIDEVTANVLLGAALILGTPLFVVFGALTDRFGRKEIFLGGCLLAAFTYIPIFHLLTHYGNPALETAQQRMPAVLVVDGTDCSVQFNPIGAAVTLSPCDLAKNVLATSAVSYRQAPAPLGTLPEVYLGDVSVSYQQARDANNGDVKLTQLAYRTALLKAIHDAGYPASADPNRIDKPMIILLLFVLVSYVAMVYGPIAAMLTELFPTRIRYTAMSLPYHLGNGWFGGFLPATAFAIVAATGNIYMGLWYPIIVATMTFFLGLFLLPETRRIPLDARD
jgi:MFS family permease